MTVRNFLLITALFLSTHLNASNILQFTLLGVEQEDLESITSSAKEKTNKIFNSEKYKKIKKKAKELYPVYKIGDKMTVPIQIGTNIQHYTGKYKGVKNGELHIGSKKVPLFDLSPLIKDSVNRRNYINRKKFIKKFFHYKRKIYYNRLLQKKLEKLGYKFNSDKKKWQKKAFDKVKKQSYDKDKVKEITGQNTNDYFYSDDENKNYSDNSEKNAEKSDENYNYDENDFDD